MSLEDKLPREFFAKCPVIGKGTLYTLKNGEYNCFRCNVTHSTNYILRINKPEDIKPRNFRIQYKMSQSNMVETMFNDHCSSCEEECLMELENSRGNDKFKYQCLGCGEKQWYQIINGEKRKTARIVRE